MIKYDFSDENLQIAINQTHDQLRKWSDGDGTETYTKLRNHLYNLIDNQFHRVSTLTDTDYKEIR